MRGRGRRGHDAIQLAKLRSLASSQETPNHFVGYAAKEEGIGLREVLGRVTMQVFVRQHCPMIAAPVNVTLMEYRRGRIT